MQYSSSVLKKTCSKKVFVIVISPAGSGHVIGNPSPKTQLGGNATPKHAPIPDTCSLLNTKIQNRILSYLRVGC